MVVHVKGASPRGGRVMTMSVKRKKQQIIMLVLLGGIIGELTFCGILVKGIVTGGNQGTVKSLTEKLAAGQKLIASEKTILDVYTKGYADLEDLADHVPKATDPYAWAYEYVSLRSQRAQIVLDEVTEVKSKSTGDEGEKPYYQIRVAMNCSYEKTVQFLKHLEEDNPLLLVAQLEINSSKDSPLSHPTEMLLQWPLDFVIEKGK